jgi:tRNA(Ile)-lysidine synthase
MPSRRRPAAPAEPLDPARLFGALSRRRGLVLAVSGGPDSTALMVLAARWRAAPPLLVVSVDHGLRAEAAAEARTVAKNAAALGLRCRIVRAPPRQTGGNLQDWARRTRYRLLADAAAEAGCDAIVTAHHRDDQAETFLLRLARGSGVYGLSAMAPESMSGEVMLARPLLGVPREALLRVAEESGLPTAEDPGNSDLRFDRVRMREALPFLEAIGLGPERLAQTATRLGCAAAALDHYATLLLREGFSADGFGVVSGEIAPLAAAPQEVALRALARMLRTVGGMEYTPRLDALEALLAAVLAADGHARMRRTLSGVVVTAEAGRLVARREWGRDGLPDAPAPAGATLLWDRRFEIAVPHVAGSLSIGALARSSRRLRAATAEAAALRTLPGLYRNGTLAATPAGVVAMDDGEPLQGLTARCLVGARLGIGA